MGLGIRLSVLDKRTLILVGLGLGLAAVSVGGQPKMSAPMVYSGLSDASGGVAIGTNLFAVADDEGNQIRIYRVDQEGPPVQIFNATRFLRLVGKFPETDLEGATWLDGKIFWIGSHGRNREGKYRPNRNSFFATSVLQTNPTVRLAPVGICYHNLLTDLMLDPRLRPFHLAAASTRAPKTKDALNIEGLCATAEGHLLLGFRNPIPNERALIVPMLNPNDVIKGFSARLGAPILLDLGGLGIRDMGYWRNKIYLLAGPYDTEKKFRLFTWSGRPEDPVEAVKGLKFNRLTPEALVFYPELPCFQVLSDDGTRKTRGTINKLLPDPKQRTFRAVWITP